MNGWTIALIVLGVLTFGVTPLFVFVIGFTNCRFEKLRKEVANFDGSNEKILLIRKLSRRYDIPPPQDFCGALYVEGKCQKCRKQLGCRIFLRFVELRELSKSGDDKQFASKIFEIIETTKQQREELEKLLSKKSSLVEN